MAIQDLDTLLSQLKPVMAAEEYVYCCLEATPQTIEPLSVFQEEEGVSVICRRQQAEDSGWSYEGVFKCITLTVHSSLEAVGLTAAVSTALTEANISANVVAAFHHDHIFVPSHRAEEALAVIESLCD